MLRALSEWPDLFSPKASIQDPTITGWNSCLIFVDSPGAESLRCINKVQQGCSTLPLLSSQNMLQYYTHFSRKVLSCNE